MNPDEPLDRLFAAVRANPPDTARAEFAFETRLLARVRAESKSSWYAWAWRLCPYFAALALAAGAWGYLHVEIIPDRESLAASLKQGGLPVFEYYLGDAE